MTSVKSGEGEEENKVGRGLKKKDLKPSLPPWDRLLYYFRMSNVNIKESNMH